MKKTPTRPAFFNPRLITGLAFCLLGVALAFLAFQNAIAQGDANAPIIKGAYRGLAPVVRFDVSPPLRSMKIIEPPSFTLRENEDRDIVPLKVRFAPEWDPV